MINEALRLFRVYNDLKLYELAQKIGLSASYLSEIEKGKKTPNLGVIEKYASFFDVPPSAILQFSEKLESDSAGIKSVIAKSIIGFLQNVETHGE